MKAPRTLSLPPPPSKAALGHKNDHNNRAMLSPRALEDNKGGTGGSWDATPIKERLTFARNEEVRYND